MRKNLFEVSEEEKKIIIKSHIEATKKNYLFESEKLQSDQFLRYILQASQRRDRPEFAIEDNGNGCMSTKLVDNNANNDLVVTACKGGHFEIAESMCWGKIFGRWELDGENYNSTHCNNNDCPIRITLPGQPIEVFYEGATGNSGGSLFPHLICYVMKKTCDKWKYYWESWSWNVDELINLANSEVNCNVPKCMAEYTNQGFWTSTAELLHLTGHECPPDPEKNIR
jgi:hypothetical protein